jgi:pyruvyl transferase EpsO
MEGFDRFRRDIDAALDRVIPRDGPVALLHYPYDGNVGNHMMWIAACEYLQSRRIPVRYVSHNDRFDLETLRQAVGGGAVLFLGGVTISRLWPRHAEIKRLIAQAMPDNRLISLPSTMLFIDEEDAREAGQLFGAHRKVTLMARDPRSGAEARKVFPEHIEVVTVPDLALRLDPQPRRAAPQHDVIWLARDDLEGAGFRPPENVHLFEWPHPWEIQESYRQMRAGTLFAKLGKLPLGARVKPLVRAPVPFLYRRASYAVLKYGNDVLDRGKVLVTDRMHPHVHAALRRQHVVLLPDKFGKNRAVYDFGTGTNEYVHWADTPPQALELAQKLAREA